jgi:regulator of sigma E protease
MSQTLGVVAFIASLVAAILLHELGHLITAKRAGMRAERYFVGFGPTLWSTRRGETEYGLKAFPLGGFVSIAGMSPGDQRQPPLVDALPRVRDSEDARLWWRALGEELDARGADAVTRRRVLDATRSLLPAHTVTGDVTSTDVDERDLRSALQRALDSEVGPSRRVGDLAHRLLLGDEGRMFTERPAHQRAIVLVTGPLTHAVIALTLLFAVQVGWPQATGVVTGVVAAVRDGSPAADAGLRVGDELLAVDGVRSSDFTVLREALRQRADVPSELTVQRDGAEQRITVVPEAVEDPTTGEVVGLIGIATVPETARVGVLDGLVAAAVGEPGPGTPGGVVPMIGESVSGLVRILSPAGLTGLVEQAVGRAEPGPDRAVSLVGAASIAGQIGAREGGLASVLILLAAINVFFLLFNLLPLPPFDGGHLAVVGIEATVNGVRRLAGRRPDWHVSPGAIASVAIPVIAVLVLLLVTTLWLDLTDPIRL